MAASQFYIHPSFRNKRKTIITKRYPDRKNLILDLD